MRTSLVHILWSLWAQRFLTSSLTLAAFTLTGEGKQEALASQHVEQAGAVRRADGQALGPHKLPAVQQGQLVGVVHGDRGVGSLVVVGQALEAQLDPRAPRRRRQVVRVKPQLYASAVKEEAGGAPEGGKVVLQGGSDVGPEQGGQVQVQQVTDCVGSQALWQLGEGEQAFRGFGCGQKNGLFLLD